MTLSRHGITLRAGFLLIIFMLVAITSRPQEPSGGFNQSHSSTRPILIGKKFDYPLKQVIRGDSLRFATGIFSWYHSGAVSVWNTQSATDLIAEIRKCEQEGLRPKEYHLSTLEFFQEKKIRTSPESAEFELLLSDAFLLYATHLMYGKTDPATIYPSWQQEKEEIDFSALLKEVQSSGNITGILHNLRPQHPNYSRLVLKLAEYRKIAAEGGWISVPISLNVQPGKDDAEIQSIKKFLVQVGDLKANAADSILYEEDVQAAVKKFQKRHGIKEDGKIGKETIAAINVPVEDRIDEIVLTLERLRWLPRNLGDQYALVNIPAFHMQVVNDHQVELEMSVAVGKIYRQTPEYSSSVDHLVLNPFWRVPTSILKNDLLPAQIKNHEYLKEKDIEVIDYSTGEVVDLADIDWDSISNRSFPYQLRQNPGKGNALGAVKFSFPNPYSIYLHDTNNRSIFNRDNRALSSGCIRLSKPMEFAVYLLKDQDEWTHDRLLKTINSRKDFAIVLKKKLPIYIQYWTAFVDDLGELNFRPDIYEKNGKLLTQFKDASVLPI